MKAKSPLAKKGVYVTVRMAGDKEIRKLNKKFRKKDKVTDVLSFNIDEKGSDGFYLGDVIVNKEQAERQAKEYGNTVEEEISELAGHGILHLLGVHHPEDE